MNTRLPYFPIPTQIQPAASFHAAFPAPFHPTTPPPTTSPNWNGNPSNRNGWKRNRNWNHQYAVPYNVPKKTFNNRFQHNRMNNNGNYDNSQKWNNKKMNNSVDSKEIREQAIPGIVATKKKRKPMSKSYPSAKWDEKDAEKALMAEKEYAKTLTNQSLIIRFPDPELGKDTVKEFHTAIENVHFPQASTPRYCYAHLKEGANIDQVVSALEKIPFGQGFLQVELKRAREENLEVSVRDIDPYTLYVGNLPLNVTKVGVIQHFNGCTRIDIGHPQQMKNTRYAFVRFGTVEDAIAAYKCTVNTLYESRSMIVRFRRINGVVGLPGENKTPTITKPTKEAVTLSAPTEPVPPEPTQLNVPVIESQKSTAQPAKPKQPDLSLVKEEPVDNDEQDVKPSLNDMSVGDSFANSSFSNSSIKPEFDIKREQLPIHKNEDEVDDEEEEEEFDARNDNFKYGNEGCEDEFDDYDDDDDYDVDDEDLGLQLNGDDIYLPGDDDEDIFNEK